MSDKKLNLILHCGASHVTRDDVDNAATPANTATHYPIPHSQLVERIQDQLGEAGYNVVQEAYGLTNEAQRFFGLMQLVHENDQKLQDHSIVIGVRNSHDKSFQASIVAGSGVFVCDNLSFSGEIKVARKHTRHILRDLNGLTHRAISQLAAKYREQELAFAAYQDTELSDEGAAHLILQGMDRKVYPASAAPKVWAEWREPKHEEFKTRNVWSLFNAVTEVAKEWSPVLSMSRTQLLHGLCDAKCGILQTAS